MMINILQVLLMIYSGVLIINLIASLVLFNIHKHLLFKVLCAMWGFSLVNFILQGIFLRPGLGMYASFSSYLFVSFSLFIFVCLILQKNWRISNLEKKAALFLVMLVITGGVIYHFTQNYFIASLVAAIAISIPMVAGAYRLSKAQNGVGPKLLSALLFLNAIHFLDYPLLRSQERGAIYGFSIALFLLFGFSTLFPAFVLLQIASDYSEGLEDEVKSRTGELGDALNLNKTLVNILCHDLSTPLTILGFYVDQISEKDYGDEYLYNIKKMSSSLSNVFNILSKVKDLQAITYGKTTLERNSINLNETINEVINSFEKLLIPKKLSIVFSSQINYQVNILADKELLKNQIFANLISNAIKFSHEKSVINIIISEKEKHIFVTVEDHGIGIPPELISKIFNWNEKTSRKGTNGEVGTGFGLPLVKTCAEMMGIEIKAESSLSENSLNNSGSRFIIQFDKFA